MKSNLIVSLFSFISSVSFSLLIGIHRFDWIIRLASQNFSLFLCLFEIFSIWHLIYFVIKLTKLEKLLQEKLAKSDKITNFLKILKDEKGKLQIDALMDEE